MSWLVPQLDGSKYAGDNCGPASVASALRWATEHEVMPTPGEVRRRMGDFVGGTTMDEHSVAWATFTREAARDGWDLHPMAFKGIAPFADLVTALRNGRAATIAIRYGALPREYRQSATFTGDHAIFISRSRRVKGRLQLRVWDPLADGRRPEIVRGPQWIEASIIRTAAEATTGHKGTVWLNVVRKSTPIEGTSPTPDREPDAGVIPGPR